MDQVLFGFEDVDEESGQELKRVDEGVVVTRWPARAWA
jgi:hypothetical protein